MAAWLARRLLQAAVTFLAVAAILFVLMRAAPGNPLSRLTDDRPMTPAEQQRLKALFGLDQPIGTQFTRFAAAATTGDFGVSIEYYPVRVNALIWSRLPASLLLGGAVLFVNLGLGIWLGVFQARRRGSAVDRWLTHLSLAGYAMPSFWLALILVSVFAIEWRLLPAAQMRDPLLNSDAGWPARAWDLLTHLVLPVVTLSVVTIAATMRYQRTAMLEVLRLDYVRAAQARGLAESTVVWRHAWRNALFPILTLVGLMLPMLVSGSVFVESVFAWPGLGSLAAGAIAARDYPVLMATALLVSGAVLVSGVLTDLGYHLLDPRTRSR
ncbi:MAG: ABC transporter permease [Gemmatimonadetes bacterium]|nr:ABC transporter permease [Gemmatimonadota bacterium]